MKNSNVDKSYDKRKMRAKDEAIKDTVKVSRKGGKKKSAGRDCIQSFDHGFFVCMEKEKKWTDHMVQILIVLITSGIVVSIISWVYHGHLERPIVKCVVQENTQNFSVNGDYRGIQMRIYPQLMIRYDKQVILLIHLKNYYEHEFLQFQDGTCQAVICHRDFVEKLKHELRDGITETVCQENPSFETEKLEQNLKIEVSSIGGVRYINRRGNQEKRYCIIETDGMVTDVALEDEEIKNRLNETELTTKEDLTEIDRIRMDEIIQTVSEEIRKMK